MVWTQAQWRDNAQRLPAFLTPLVDELGRSERRAGGGLYVQGLLLPGQRKSIEPMAERLGVEAQKLQQFITDSPWEEGKVWAAIRREVVGALAPAVAWIVDETGWLKQGRHSVGVAHQDCGAAGKSANCQVNVQVALTDGEVAVPVAARLYLPATWTGDRARCQAAGIPATIPLCHQAADGPGPTRRSAGVGRRPSAGAGRQCVRPQRSLPRGRAGLAVGVLPAN